MPTGRRPVDETKRYRLRVVLEDEDNGSTEIAFTATRDQLNGNSALLAGVLQIHEASTGELVDAAAQAGARVSVKRRGRPRKK